MDNSGAAGNVEVRNVEVRYAGVVVGRGALLKELGPDAAFVGLPEPLPVGTLVTLKIGDALREARVDDVVESAEPAAVGMRVRWGGAAPSARSAPAPAPATSTPAAPAAPAAAASHGVVTATPGESGPTVAAQSGPTVAAQSGPTVAAPADDEGSGAIAAPLSLASPTGDGAQHGGGKRRRKRR